MIPVSQFMSMKVYGVDQDLSVDELASFLVEHDITGAPVLDQNERVVGVVSMTDLVHVQALPGDYFYGHMEYVPTTDKVPKELAKLKVKDIMTRRVLAVAEDDPIDEAARLLREYRIHRLLVTRENRVVGIITSFDLLRAIQVLSDRLERKPAPPRAR